MSKYPIYLQKESFKFKYMTIVHADSLIVKIMDQISLKTPNCREIITVRGQSYVSRLPKY
jgi:hypothetical protein